MEFTEAVPVSDVRRIRGGSWFWGPILGKWDVDDVMHSSDQFNDLDFRVVSLLPGPACSDALDNDGDDFVDLGDPGCADGGDLDERAAVPGSARWLWSRRRAGARQSAPGLRSESETARELTRFSSHGAPI